MAKVTPLQTPCCLDGYLKSDPNSSDFYCAKCQKVYTPQDLIHILNVGKGTAVPQMLPLHGNTYPVKEELKALGARWNQKDRVWMVPEDRMTEAQRIVLRGPDPSFAPPSGGQGAAPYQRNYQPPPGKQYPYTPAPRLEERLCWECGTSFTEIGDGSWDDYWCGCTDKPRLVAKTPPRSAEHEPYGVRTATGRRRTGRRWSP